MQKCLCQSGSVTPCCDPTLLELCVITKRRRVENACPGTAGNRAGNAAAAASGGQVCLHGSQVSAASLLVRCALLGRKNPAQLTLAVLISPCMLSMRHLTMLSRISWAATSPHILFQDLQNAAVSRSVQYGARTAPAVFLFS